MERNEANPFKGMVDVGQAEDIFNEFRIKNKDDKDAQLVMISDLLDALLTSEEILCGEADEFHNFAVTISKVTNSNKDAYAIVREGLKIHATNTDLLADALMYGSNVGEQEECERWYRNLQAVDKSFWTWRAFSFAIDYLMDHCLSTKTFTVKIEDVLALADEYQKFRPDDEDAWIAKYRIFDRSNQKAKSIEVLEEAIEKFRFCPRCWLRYADAMIDQGEYEKAEPIIKKMLRNPNTTEAINTSYMYFLDGQCKMAKLIATDAYEEGNVEEADVRKIYRAFRLARKSQGLRDNVDQRIEEYIQRLSAETGFEYED